MAAINHQPYLADPLLDPYKGNKPSCCDMLMADSLGVALQRHFLSFICMVFLADFGIIFPGMPSLGTLVIACIVTAYSDGLIGDVIPLCRT